MNGRTRLLAGLMITASACSSATDPDPGTDKSAPSLSSAGSDHGQEAATVVRVDDGDSLIVLINGREERVRLIGVNAPEQGECIADVARSTLGALVEGKDVVLERDIEDTDRFGRLLRYVRIDGELINETLAALGVVIARGYDPNLANQDSLDAAQERAQVADLGMWAENACGPTVQADIVVLAIQSNPPGRDEDNLNGEFVIFENASSELVDLSGFTLRDSSSGNRFTFPPGFVVGGDDQFAVYVGCGDDTLRELFWCHAGPVWSNDGDELFLTDQAGSIVAYESY